MWAVLLLAPMIKTLVFKYGLPWIIKPWDQASKDIVQSFYDSYRGKEGTRRFLKILRWGNPKVVLGKTASLIPQVAVPTLILHGKEDRTVPVDFAMRAANLIENSSVHLIEGSHFFPLVMAEEFCKRLMEFLQKQKAMD